MITTSAAAALLWKTWREHRVIAALLAVFVAVGWTAEACTHSGILQGMLQLLVTILPPILAFHSISSEDATSGIADGLPVRPALPTALRLLAGVLLTIAPVAFVQLGVYWMPKAITNNSTHPALFPLISPLLYLWIVVLGARARSEIHIALCGLFILTTHYFGLLLATIGWLPSMLHIPLLFLIPAVGYADASLPLPLLLAIDLLMLLLLFAVATARLARRSNASGSAASAPSRRRSLNLIVWKFHSPAASLVWKSWREVRGLFAGAALVTLVLVTTLTLFANGLFGGGRRWDRLEDLMNTAQFTVPIVGVIVGTVLSLILGITLSCNDARRGLELFLASRPVPMKRYFWIRYCTGLTLIVSHCAAAAGLWIALPLLGGQTPSFHPFADLTPLAWYTVLQLFIYTIAMLLGTLLRRPVITAVATLAATWGLSIAILVIVSMQKTDTTESAITLYLLLTFGLLYAAFRLSARHRPAL